MKDDAYREMRYDLALGIEADGAFLTADSDHPLVIERQGRNGPERGFMLRLHQEDPNAPLQPFYFNLRTPDNPKPGPLTPGTIYLATDCMREIVVRKKLEFDAVAGVPDAGKRFAKALAVLVNKPCLEMEKWEHGGKRHIAQLKGPIDVSIKKVLYVDDVIMRATSKIEAINIGRDAGLEITDVMVVIDYEQGGRDSLAALGCNLHSVFAVIELLKLYAELGKISPQLNQDIQKYLASQV
ncbi:MAG: hypothetical protein Q8P23_00265 [bacterium]|nr:hypothetical protein [bacterium]